MTASFSSSERAALERTSDASSRPCKTRAELFHYYEISKCITFVQTGNHQSVTLQFPDELLPDAAAVASLIEEKTQSQPYILADTSYGSCCVDEIAAQHVNSDCLIHFGPASLDPGLRVPVLYVFGREAIDVDDCVSKFRELFSDPTYRVLLISDVIYYHIQDEIVEILKSTHVNLVAAEIDSKLTETSPAGCACSQSEGSKMKYFGRIFSLPDEKSLHDYAVFFIGREGPVLVNFMMALNKSSFSSYDPVTRMGRRETLDVNRALMKRYYLIQKAKDANVVGIIVGTLGIGDYLGILDRVKEIIKKAGKKSYTFVVGKLNPAKLANFMEIDVYVLIAAPENSLVDSKEFYRPILTPFEIEIACLKSRDWTGEYFTDFRELLPGAARHVDLANEPEPQSEPEYSLITGELRSLHIPEKGPPEKSTEIAVRSKLDVATIEPGGTRFLSSRSWQGLEPRLGETDVVKAKEGRRGIAIAYEDEPTS